LYYSSYKVLVAECGNGVFAVT